MIREKLEDFGQKATAALRAGVVFGLLAWGDAIVASVLLMTVNSTFGSMIIMTLWAAVLYGALRAGSAVYVKSLPEEDEE